MRESWYEDRYELDDEGKPVKPQWHFIDQAKDVADLIEYDYCEMDVPESEELRLELDKLCDGLEHGALDCQLFQLAPDLRRAALKLELKTKQGDAKALKLAVKKASRLRRQDLKKLKALEDPVWKQKLRKQLKDVSRRQALQSLVPKTGLSAAQKKAAAKAVSKAILDGQAQPLQPVQSPSKKMKTGLLAISMALTLRCCQTPVSACELLRLGGCPG